MPDSTAERLEAVENRVDDHDKRIGELETDMGEIRTYLGDVATKGDIERLRSALTEIRGHVDSAINGILRDALNAVPTWHAALWTGVAALIAAAALAVGLLH